MRLISHEKSCARLYKQHWGIKVRQKEIANFRKDMVRKDKRIWDALKGASGAVGLPVSELTALFELESFGWSHVSSCDHELTVQTTTVLCFDKYNMVS